jgi:hypothetical protein
MIAPRRNVCVSGHQPTYLPWLGLFHKISLCDVFIFMDDVQYLSGDWNNRNKIKGPGGPFWLTVPVRRKASASPLLKDILVEDANGGRKDWQAAHLRSLEGCYRTAPYWKRYEKWLRNIYLGSRWTHLAALCETMLRFFMDELRFAPRFERASALNFTGQKSDLVMEHCVRFEATLCVLGAHGRSYINQADLTDRGISLYFQDYKHPAYGQKFGAFASHMSIIDLLFNYGPDSRDILMRGNVTRQELENCITAATMPSILAPCAKESVP